MTPGELNELVAAEVLDDEDQATFQERLLRTLGTGLAGVISCWSKQPIDPDDIVAKDKRNKKRRTKPASVADQKAFFTSIASAQWAKFNGESQRHSSQPNRTDGKLRQEYVPFW